MAQPAPPVDGRILLLGLTPLASARALARHGVSLVCAVKPEDADAARRSGLLDESVVVSNPANAEQVVSAVMRTGADIRFSAVATASEGPMVTTSLVGRALEVPSLSLPCALALHDKFLQKQLVAQAGVPTATAGIVHYSDADMVAVDEYPVVIKPFTDAGPRGTAVIRTRNDLRTFVSAAKAEGAPGPWLVEEYVEGDAVHIDGVIREGELMFISVGRYLDKPIDITHGDLYGSVLLDPQHNEQIYSAARVMVTRSLHALGHRDGVFHLEAFLQANQLMFGECSGRVSGGQIPDVIQQKFGVDLHDEWARCVLGTSSGMHDRASSDQSYGWMHLSAPAGTLSARSTGELELLPGVVEVDLEVAAGELVSDDSQDAVPRVASVQVAADTYDEVSERLIEVASWLASRAWTAPHQG